MTCSPLRDFITRLEADGGLSRISVAVDTDLEIAAITDRVCKQPHGGPALLFELPGRSRFPVTTNLFGSSQRVCRALTINTLDELSARLQTLLDHITGSDITTIGGQLAVLPRFTRFAPSVSAASDPMMDSMDHPDLTVFPFLKSWPDDGSADGHGRYITLPQIFTADPDGGTANCGLYRVQVRGEREAAIQWKAGSGAAAHAELFRHAGKPMPVAIALGGDPAALFSAMFPLPESLDELTFAGFLRGVPLETAPCRTVPLQVPAGAEVVIEGFVNPGETVTEGPFGNHTGFYSPAAAASLMRITAIRHRPDAIIPATVVGPPPMEDCWMAQAWERVLLAFLHKMVPSITDIHFPFEWVFHQSAIISLENPHPGMVRNISAQLWALPWFRAARLLIFVTTGTIPADLSYAAWKSMNVTDSTHDCYRENATGRMAVDATGCRAPRPDIATSADAAARVVSRWQEYGIA